MEKFGPRLWIDAAIIALAAAMMAAATSWSVTVVQLWTAEQDLDQAKADAAARVALRERIIASHFPPEIPSPFRLVQTPEDEYRIELQRIHNQMLLGRQNFAEGFMMRSVLLGLVLGCLYVFTHATDEGIP